MGPPADGHMRQLFRNMRVRKFDYAWHEGGAHVMRSVHFSYNVHPYDKRLTLCRDMTKLCRAGYGVRLRYVKLVVVLVATQACPATACVSCQRDVR